MASYSTIRTHIDSVNNEAREATMRLYGAIGEKVDGDLFARELASLDDGQLDAIRIRINSPGGDVFQGMSIISAMLSVKTPVYAHIDGIAASMAAVVAVAAKRVYMMDFAKLMIHDPYFAGKQPGTLSDEQKNMLARMSDMLRRVLSRRGCNEEDIAQLMQAEAWLSADEAHTAGLCDEITPSMNSDLKNLTPLQLVAVIDAKNSTQMQTYNNDLHRQIIALLGLQEDATDAEILDNINSLMNNPENPEQSVNNAVRLGFIDRTEAASYTAMARSNPTAFRGLIADKRTTQKKALADTLVAAIRKGKIIPQDRHLFETVGECMGANAVRRIIDCIPERVRLMDLIDGAHKNRANWKLADYRKYAPEELRNNPTLYAQLLEREGREMELNAETLDYYRRNKPEYLAAHPEEYQRLINNKQSV